MMVGSGCLRRMCVNLRFCMVVVMQSPGDSCGGEVLAGSGGECDAYCEEGGGGY